MNRPPTKAEVEAIRKRAEHAHLDDVIFATADVEALLAYIDHQEQVTQGLREDLRDAGRELREMQGESAEWQSRYEEQTGGGW